jgi:methionyl aminopeptidase
VVKIPIKTEAEIAGIRAASQLTAQILEGVTAILRPGMTTEDINSFVHSMMLKNGAKPATLNYRGFPKSCCTSVNDVVCHGVPSIYETLRAGDIINIDVTSIKNGYYGDASRMYFIGGREAASEEARILVDITRQALEIGMAEVGPGKRFGDIGAAIQEFIAQQDRPYGIVREYTGHGVGKEFHEPPQVQHVGRRNTGPEMLPGMTFTIEPMINLGTHKTTLSHVDGWTVRTADGALSAQWEHTLLVTANGYEALTS